MIETIKGNLLAAKGIIVHGCNAQGVMGSGVAKAIREKWPVTFKKYREHYERYGSRLGAVIPVWVDVDTLVINGITQEFYGRDGKRYVDYDAVRSVFKFTRGWAQEWNMPVNFPLIGCGLGGGDWQIIENIIEEELPGIEKRLWIKE